MTFDSIAEYKASPAIAALGGARCAHFTAPFSRSYYDAEEVQLDGHPDFLITRSGKRRYIELKVGALNRHYTRRSSHEALQHVYHGGPQSHSFLSNHFWTNCYGSGKTICLADSFNHSLFKVLAMQAQHGYRNYFVVFRTNPKPADAARYAACGLIYCTAKTLEQFLCRLDLLDAGIGSTFRITTTKYTYTMTFDNGTATANEVRTHFLAVVAADRKAVAVAQTRYAGDEAAGILPY